MEQISKRSEQFRAWLKDMTPEKEELLVEFEKKARMVAHVFALIGEPDPKLVEGLTEISNEIRMAYEAPAA